MFQGRGRMEESGLVALVLIHSVLCHIFLTHPLILCLFTAQHVPIDAVVEHPVAPRHHVHKPVLQTAEQSGIHLGLPSLQRSGSHPLSASASTGLVCVVQKYIHGRFIRGECLYLCIYLEWLCSSCYLFYCCYYCHFHSSFLFIRFCNCYCNYLLRLLLFFLLVLFSLWLSL